MAWNNESASPLNGWFDMQEKMLKGWWDLLEPAQNKSQAASTANALWESWATQGLQQWQTLYQENFMAASQQVMADVTKHTLSQFLNGQGQAQHLTHMVTEAWQAMLTNANSPAEWQNALTAYTDQVRQQMKLAFDNTKLIENSAELWRLYYAEAQKLAQPWFTAWWQTPVFMSKLHGADHAAATNEFMQLLQAAFEQTMGRGLMAPSLGLTREFNEKVSKAFDLWLTNQQAQSTYLLLLGEAWLAAFQALMKKLVEMAQKGETITDQRHLVRIWVAVADEVFIELFHSEAYATAQSTYVNSNMTLRRQQRTLLEVWLRQNDMPTRTDLDEAHHQIYELRKEMRALKKSVATHETQLLAIAPAGKAKTTAKPTAKPTAKSTAKRPASAAKAPARMAEAQGAAIRSGAREATDAQEETA